MRTTIRLSDDILRRAKRKAQAEGRTLTSLLEEGLARVLAEDGKATRKKRKLPPVCNAGGGLMPGVDPVKLLAADEDVADIEMLHRTVGKR